MGEPNRAAAEDSDGRLNEAINDFILEENRRLQAQVEQMQQVQVATQKSMDAVTADLGRRGDQIGQAMLNLSTIASNLQHINGSINALATGITASQRQQIVLLERLADTLAPEPKEES